MQHADAVVRLEDVSLSYRKDSTPALRNVSAEIGPGVVGLVGANGAGKTSLLRIISGSLKPSAGRVTVGGETPDAFRRSGRLGSIPDFPRFPAYLTVGEFLAGIRRLCAESATSSAENALAESLAIADLNTRRLSELSLGQMRRVELLAALAGDPDVLLLDEPTNGLDPIAVAALRRGIGAAQRPGRLILISSHHLDELQRVADQVLFLHAGTLVVSWNREHPDASETSLESLFLSLEHAADA